MIVIPPSDCSGSWFPLPAVLHRLGRRGRILEVGRHASSRAEPTAASAVHPRPMRRKSCELAGPTRCRAVCWCRLSGFATRQSAWAPRHLEAGGNCHGGDGMGLRQGHFDQPRCRSFCSAAIFHWAIRRQAADPHRQASRWNCAPCWSGARCKDHCASPRRWTPSS